MIAHFDIDAFYASVAQHDDPSLRGLPLAVAGDSRRSVVLTASYEARPFGVRSAMPLWRAKALCPALRVVPPAFPRYKELSRAVFAIFGAGGGAVEGLSLDEAFVDLGDCALADAVARAAAVRSAVRDEVGLTVSAGVAAQKMVAKIASDAAKPDGLAAIEPGTEAAYLAPMPVARLWGVGPKTQQRLEAAGIATIGDVAALDDATAFRLFGRGGAGVRELARGYDGRGVESGRETRSVSTETTFEYDVVDLAQLRLVIAEAANEVAARLRAHGLRGGTIGIKLKFANFAVAGKQLSVAEPTDDPAAIEAAALRCLEVFPLEGRAVRLAGVRVASLTEAATVQLSMFG